MARTDERGARDRESMTLTSIRSIDALEALKPEWDALWQRLPQASHYHSADYALHSWRELAEPSGYRLFCVTGCVDGRLVLVWPLKIRRKLLWRIGRPLSSNLAEQTDLLTEDSPQAEARTDAALDFVMREAKADILDLPLVPAGTRLAARLRGPSTGGSRKADVIPFVRWAQDESFEDYAADLSRTTRKVVDKKHRRLRTMGELRFEIVSDRPDASATVRSLLGFKRAWAEKLPDASIWIHGAEFERFLTTMPTVSENDPSGIVLFVLKLDGRLLAAQIAAVGHQVDWLAAAYNPDFHQLSPGIVLNEYCLRWAHARGLPVLMGSGQQANKEFWCKKQSVRSVSYRMPASMLGTATFQAGRLREMLRSTGRPRPAAAPSTRPSGRAAFAGATKDVD